MAKKIFKVLKGPHAGLVFAGLQIGARFFPDGPVSWDKTGDRVWCPELKQSFSCSSFDPKGTNEAENLYVPHDKYDNEIKIGDKIYVAVGRGVVLAKVIGLGKPHHHGCGWHERQLKLQDTKTGRKFSHNYPHESIKFI